MNYRKDNYGAGRLIAGRLRERHEESPGNKEHHTS